jgi:hypothetical protein
MIGRSGRTCLSSGLGLPTLDRIETINVARSEPGIPEHVLEAVAAHSGLSVDDVRRSLRAFASVGRKGNMARVEGPRGTISFRVV